MKKTLFGMVIIAALISACSSTAARQPETIPVREEVQAPAGGDEIAGELPELAEDTSVSAGAPPVSQPSEEIEEVTAAAEAPSFDEPVATYTPCPTYTPFPTLQAEPQDEAYMPTSTAVGATVETAATDMAEDQTSETSTEETTQAVKAGEALEPSTTETFTTREMSSETPTLERIEMTDIEVAAETISETAEETTAQTVGESATEAVTASPTPKETPAPPSAETGSVNQAPAAQSVELARIPDTDPAPPLTILVSTVQTEQNGYYKLTGTIRNDGSETYGGVGVVATFYEEENACTTHEETRRGRDGSERTVTVEDCDYNWHGPVEVYAACQLLEPGAECPFSLEIYGRDYVSYLLHPEGTPVEYRQPASLSLTGVNVYNNGLGYVRITGTATNENPFTVRDANIAGTLIDASGQIASVGSVLVPGEIVPGASVSFDLRIENEPYSSYELNAQATQS